MSFDFGAFAGGLAPGISKATDRYVKQVEDEVDRRETAKWNQVAFLSKGIHDPNTTKAYKGECMTILSTIMPELNLPAGSDSMFDDNTVKPFFKQFSDMAKSKDLSNLQKQNRAAEIVAEALEAGVPQAEVESFRQNIEQRLALQEKAAVKAREREQYTIPGAVVKPPVQAPASQAVPQDFNNTYAGLIQKGMGDDIFYGKGRGGMADIGQASDYDVQTTETQPGEVQAVGMGGQKPVSVKPGGTGLPDTTKPDIQPAIKDPATDPPYTHQLLIEKYGMDGYKAGITRWNANKNLSIEQAFKGIPELTVVSKGQTPMYKTLGVGNGYVQNFQYNPKTGKHDISAGEKYLKHRPHEAKEVKPTGEPGDPYRSMKDAVSIAEKIYGDLEFIPKTELDAILNKLMYKQEPQPKTREGDFKKGSVLDKDSGKRVPVTLVYKNGKWELKPGGPGSPPRVQSDKEKAILKRTPVKPVVKKSELEARRVKKLKAILTPAERTAYIKIYGSAAKARLAARQDGETWDAKELYNRGNK